MERMLRLAAAAGVLALAISCGTGQPSPSALSRYWESHPSDPRDYLVGKFSKYDWVFLGEYHRVKHDLDLVASLIPALHEKTGVRTLAWEFLKREAADRANELVAAPVYDRRAVIAFFRDQFASWSYEEYLSIFKAAWESNRRWAGEKGPFVFVGLHPDIRWDLINYGTAEESAREQDKQRRYDEIMARSLEENVLSRGRPALIYSGIAHATGKYKEYYVGQGDRQLVRMGNMVYREPYKDRMFFVACHAPFYDAGTNADIYPFDGILDRMMKAYGKDIGFDIVGTPFARLTHAKRSPYSITDHAFGELYDGYIMFRTPIKEYRGMTCVADWIETPQDFEHYWRNLTNKEASQEFSKIPFEEFRATFCSDNPDYGDGFARRFRRLPDVEASSGAGRPAPGTALSGPGLSRKAAPAPSATDRPTSGWRTGAPEEKGFDSLKLAEGLLAIRRNGLDLHSVSIVRDGVMVLDAYFYPYDGETVHDQASVTKSIMTALIGIAADQGRLRLDEPMLSFFPGRAIANRNASKERVTVRHLASMSSGLECISANDEQTLHEMEESPDFVQFTLDRAMISEPGTRFVYCSPGMHLLSAILQKATGMTALEFARLHLFGPLGIQNVIWPTDAQGFNHGWGDIRLHPHDAARIGLLWLNHGRWEGRQIVSREWVDSSIRTQIKTGRDDDYGYGWWVTGDEGEFAAIGRGGQRIQVWPSINAILVMTGGGVDIDDIEPMITPAFMGRDKPLPANPSGVARLKEVLAAVAASPSPKPVALLPATAKRIAGQTFVFDPNPLEIEACSLEFTTDPAVAVFRITHAGGKQEPWPVGLDGVYRMSEGPFGLPQGLRGGWVDDRTFALEYDNIGNNDHVHLRLSFARDRVTVESRETAHELGARFEGRAAPAK